MLGTLLYLIDLFGRPITINFSGQEKFKSRFGGLCSILFFAFLVWAAYNGSRDLFAREKPITVGSETYEENPRAMILSPETFPFGIGMQTPSALGTVPYIDDSIFTVDFNYVRMQTIKHPNGSATTTRKRVTMAKEKCTPSHYGDGAQNYATIDLSQVYCIAKEQPEVNELRIQGVMSSNVFEYVTILVKACNSTISPVPCAPPEKIKEYLSKAWFNVLYLNLAVNPKNYTHPEVKFRELYSTIIDTTSYKEANLFLGHVNVTTDSGWIVPEPETKSYIKVNKIEDFFVLEPDSRGNLMAFLIQVSGIETTYVRTYKTIQNILAEVGGLANVALAILLVITTPYLKLKFCLTLINELFDIHPVVEKRRKASKKKNATRSAKTPNDSDSDQEKHEVEVQIDKSDNAKKELSKSPQSDHLFTRSPNYSGMFSEEAKLDVNSDDQMPKSKELHSPKGYLELPTMGHNQKIKNQKALSKNTHDSDANAKKTKFNSKIRRNKSNDIKEGDVETNQPSEPIYLTSVQGSEIGYEETNPNINLNRALSKKGEIATPHTGTYFPLETKPPVSEQENDTAVNKNPSLKKLSSLSKFMLSGSPSYKEGQYESFEPQQEKEELSPEALQTTPKDILRFSSVYNKQNLTKISQKIIDQNANRDISSLIVSIDDSSDSCEENNKKMVESIQSQPITSQHNLREYTIKEPAKLNVNAPASANEDNEKQSQGKKNLEKVQKAIIPKLASKPYKLDITFWQYIFSFFYKSEAHKLKMDVIAQGIKNIETRLDLINIMKKFREIDKLKAMLLDIDQAILFNSLPKPEIKPKGLGNAQGDSFTQAILKKPTFIEKGQTPSMVFDSHVKLQEKWKKSKIDQKLIAIFKDKTT